MDVVLMLDLLKVYVTQNAYWENLNKEDICFQWREEVYASAANDYELKIIIIERYLSQFPDAPDLLWEMASYLFVTGNFKKAHEYIQILLKLYPDINFYKNLYYNIISQTYLTLFVYSTNEIERNEYFKKYEIFEKQAHDVLVLCIKEVKESVDDFKRQM